jgi:hypothetical protein
MRKSCLSIYLSVYPHLYLDFYASSARRAWSERSNAQNISDSLYIPVIFFEAPNQLLNFDDIDVEILHQ